MPTPTEIAERLIAGVADLSPGSLAALPELYADDTDVRHMFGVAEPSRWRGRDELRKHFSRNGNIPLERSVDNLVIRRTDDPEVVVAEYDMHCRVTTTGRTATIANVLVLRVRDGLIVESRDYHDHLALAALFDRLPDLVTDATTRYAG